MIIGSRVLRFFTALACSVLVGVVTMLLIGFVLPWAIGALRNPGIPSDAGIEAFSWMVLFVPVGAIVSLSVVGFLLVRIYDRLGGGRGSPGTSSNNRWRGP